MFTSMNLKQKTACFSKISILVLFIFFMLIPSHQASAQAARWENGQAVFTPVAARNHARANRVSPRRRAKRRARSRGRTSRNRRYRRSRSRKTRYSRSRRQKRRNRSSREAVAINQLSTSRKNRRSVRRRSSSRSRRSQRYARSKFVKPVVQKKPNQKKLKKKTHQEPLQIIVSIPQQRIRVYRGTRRIASSRVSTGKKGHSTPTGVFSIIQKNRRHFSNLYNGAPMPYMQRITWSGIALHAGNIPGYPASHGCIRLPYSFARKLFRYTKMGGHVIVQRGQGAPTPFAHANLIAPVIPAQNLLGQNETDPSNMSTVSKIKYNHTSTHSSLVNKAVMGAPQKTASTVSYKNEAPLRILVTRTTKREKLRAAQVLLAQLGYEPGRTDGHWSKRTGMALQLFQEDMELPVTGKYDDVLIDRLQAATGRKMIGSGHLYVRQNHIDLFDSPIDIAEGDTKLGTHIFTALNVDDTGETETKWSAISVRESGSSKRKRVKVRYKRRGRWRTRYKYIYKKSKKMNASQALDQVSIPANLRKRIGKILTPGSSIIISDYSYSYETGKGTDFVVLTK